MCMFAHTLFFLVANHFLTTKPLSYYCKPFFRLSIISHGPNGTHLCLWSRYLRYLISWGPLMLSNISVFLLLVTSTGLKWVMAVSDWVLCGIEPRPLAISDCPPLPITQQEVISAMPGVLTPVASPCLETRCKWIHTGNTGPEWQKTAKYRFLLAGSNRQPIEGKRLVLFPLHHGCFCHAAPVWLQVFGI